jgi:hypothetical protein
MNTASRLELHPATVLVGMETARAALGLDAEEVLEQVEQGRLRWVWDISCRRAAPPEAAPAPGSTPGPGREASPAGRMPFGLNREPRFWTRELCAPDLCRGLTSEDAIQAVLGRGHNHWPASHVARLLLCSRPAVLRLLRAGELAGPIRAGVRWIARESLEGFLRRRLWR